MKEAMFCDYKLFTSKEVKTIWEVTMALRTGAPISTARFDHAIAILDEKKPDLKFDELRLLANYHGIIGVLA